MREFNYSDLDIQLFDRETVGLLSAIHEYKGKQSLYIKGKSGYILHSRIDVTIKKYKAQQM